MQTWIRYFVVYPTQKSQPYFPLSSVIITMTLSHYLSHHGTCIFNASVFK